MLRSDQTSARQTADLRDSGSIERDADSIIMLYREAVYDEHSPQHHLQNLSSQKQVWITWYCVSTIHYETFLVRREEAKRGINQQDNTR